MSSVSNMLNIVMDGIKDTNMILDYCKEEEDPAEKDWFCKVARKRYEMLTDEFNYVINYLDLPGRIRAGDEISEALHDHLMYQIEDIEKRM